MSRPQDHTSETIDNEELDDFWEREQAWASWWSANFLVTGNAQVLRLA
jgi:hypothetical protein